MSDPQSRLVILYRWFVFATAAFYSVYMITTSSYDGPGGPFRYLTIWALLLSFYSASRMLAFSELRVDRNADVVPSVAAVLNAMVVYLYWSLVFQDPSLVRNEEPIIWWTEYYLHLVGPILQWIDAFFIRRAFRRPLAALAGLVVVVVAYVAWAEGFVGPMNSAPVGSVTSGLPYPFLNNMDLTGRVIYYGSVGVASAVLLGVFALVAAGIRRLWPDRPPEL